MRKKQFSRPHAKRYIINEGIRGDKLRVIGEDGSQIGVMERNEALLYAQKEELDLVLIAPNVQPPVVRVIDYKKFLYQEEKKGRDSKKGQKKSDTKDIKISLFIGEADLERQIRKAQEFLNEGHQLRLKIPLRGRELGKKDRAFILAQKVIDLLPGAIVSSPPKFQGRELNSVIVKGK